MHETSALSPFGTFQFDLDRGWAGVWVRDSGVVGQALREESEYFIWGLKMLREKTRQNCYIFFSSILELYAFACADLPKIWYLCV